jgi:hypothetical protein
MKKKLSVSISLIAVLFMTGNYAAAGENQNKAQKGMDRQTEVSLADVKNWTPSNRDIQSDDDQKELDQRQNLNSLVTVASAKVFAPANTKASAKAPAPIYNLVNHNGPVLSEVHLYAIWWGPTANFPTGYRSGIDAALNGVQCSTSTCSGMSKLINQYFPTNVRASISFGGDLVDTSAPIASAPSTAAIVTEVNKVVGNANLDPKGLYLVFTSNFPSKAAYCGWHGAGAVSNKWFTVSYLPNLNGQAGCAATYLPSYAATPGRSLAVDSIVNVFTHELYETATDPILNNLYAWYDALGNEIGDKCAWTTSTKVTMGAAGEFTIQQEWSNALKACSNA